jgi:hypothetical protein
MLYTKITFLQKMLFLKHFYWVVVKQYFHKLILFAYQSTLFFLNFLHKNTRF